MFKICVIGAGYVGSTTAALFASLGNTVSAFEINEARLESLRAGNLPMFEPGLQGYLREGISKGRLEFTNDLSSAANDADFVFICVPTPSLEDGSADMSFVLQAARSLSGIVKAGAILITKSTVPVGSVSDLEREIARPDVHVVSNPEFLREGSAVFDFFNPDRIVIGSSNRTAAEKVAELYAKVQAPILITDSKSSELIKYASNSFLAIKLSFVNEIARLCDGLGANAEDVLNGFGLDSRIGSKFTRTGPGWGGSCFPKDTRALSALAKSFEINLQMVDAAIESNLNAKLHVIKILRRSLGGQLQGKRIAVWGLTFKAFTDDTRESPAIHICQLLLEQGCEVVSFDPQVREVSSRAIAIADSAIDCTHGADALLVLTEWPEFSEAIPSEVLESMAGDSVIDTRGVLDPANWRAAGANLRILGNSN